MNEVIGEKALEGAIERIIAASNSETQETQWESQWHNWDDTGGGDWGDIGD